MNLLSEIDGIERIRLSSVNPSFIGEKFITSISNEKKICNHFHLSLQSGCDKTLTDMRRKYSVKTLLENIERIKNLIPDVCFTADVICGFPGETDEDFEKTRETIKKIGLIHAHIFPYSERPNTEAASMENKVPENIKNQRCAILDNDVSISKKEIIDSFISKNTQFSALFETEKNCYYFGHTENYIPVYIYSPNEKLCGQIKNIVIISNNDENGYFECK